MAHSPHRRHKGCRICTPHKDLRLGRGEREPWRVIRALGKRRRLTHRDLGDQEWDLERDQ